MSAPARPGRSLAQKLGAIVLGFEAIVVILAGLTIFGLRALPTEVPQWWALVGAAIVAVAMVATAGMIARPGAILVGWVLQAVVLASAIIVPAILLVVLIFGGMWGYATIWGARVDRRPIPGQPADTHTQPADTHTESE